MKIYAYTISNDLSQYVGKDVWVLCKFYMTTRRQRKPHWSSVNFWVRFLSEDADSYEINTCGATSNYEKDYDFLLRIWDDYDRNRQTEFKDRIMAVEPLVVLGA